MGEKGHFLSRPSFPRLTVPILPQFPHCARGIKLEVGRRSKGSKVPYHWEIQGCLFFPSLLVRVAPVKVKISSAGVGWGQAVECFVWRNGWAVASVAENIGSGHACLRSNPITPCGWAPKIAPFSPIITVGSVFPTPATIVLPSPAQSWLTLLLPACWGTPE